MFPSPIALSLPSGSTKCVLLFIAWKSMLFRNPNLGCCMFWFIIELANQYWIMGVRTNISNNRQICQRCKSDLPNPTPAISNPLPTWLTDGLGWILHRKWLVHCGFAYSFQCDGGRIWKDGLKLYKTLRRANKYFFFKDQICWLGDY